METFGQCLKAWLKSEKISASALSDRLQYKSKTTVMRIMQGTSNPESCERLCSRLSPLLEENWQVRFQKALTAERVGPLRAEMFTAIHEQLFKVEHPSARTEPPMIKPLPAKGGRLIILGDLILPDKLLNQSEGLQAAHYLTNEELLTLPSALSGVIHRLPCGSYQAYMLSKEKLSGLRITWNTAFYLSSDGSEALWLLCGAGFTRWFPLPDGADAVRRLEDQLLALEPVSLYRYSQLTSGSDMIRFTQEALRLERNRKTVIVKPTPGMQMLPEAAVESAFKDYLAQNDEPLTTAQGTLIETFEKRVDNFYHRKKPTFLFFSANAMKSFFQTGLLTDQFYAFRPFTVEERLQCLQRLASFAQQENVSAVMQDKASLPVSMEVYAGGGVLLYPSKTSYNTAQAAYRELLLPGKPFTDLFIAYAEAFLFPEQSDNEAFLAQCRRLISLAAVNERP